MVYPNEEQVYSLQLKARITATLGGQAAEDIVFGGEVTTGAGHDLQQVTGLARQMVTSLECRSGSAVLRNPKW